MELPITRRVPSIAELHDIVKTKLAGKYTCDVVYDRWSLSLKTDKKCVLIKKSGMVGVGVFLNEQKGVVDIDGIVPSQVLDKTIFGNFITRLLLVSSWNKLEAEVTDALRSKLS